MIVFYLKHTDAARDRKDVSNPVYNKASAVKMICIGASLQVSGRCNIVIKSAGKHAQHLPVGVRGFGSKRAKGPRTTRTFVSPGDLICYNNNNNNGPVTYKTLTSHCHSVCLSHPAIYPQRTFADQAWVCTFGAILDSPFVLAFV